MGNFFSFNGRANRARYLKQGLAIIAVELVIMFGVAAAINQTVGWSQEDFATFSLVVGSIANVFAAFPVVRRLHDLDRPSAHYWLLLIPFYNIYLAFCLLLQKGTDGPNRFGPDPLGAHGVAAPTSTPVPPPPPAWEAPRPSPQQQRDLTVPSVPAGQFEPRPTEPPAVWPSAPAPEVARPRTVAENPAPSRDKTQFFAAVAKPDASELPSPPPANGDARKIVGFLVTYSWRPDGDLFPVREGRNLIGRDPEQCDIAIPQDEQLSAVNSHVTYRKNFVIGDMTSMGGTDVDSESVQQQFHPLPNYATIRTGATVWTFIAVSPAQPAKSDV